MTDLGGIPLDQNTLVAFLLVLAFELLHAVQDYQTLIYGILMIACMLWLPNGILSLAVGRDAKQRTRRS